MIKIQAQALLLSAVIGANGKPKRLRRLVCSAWRRLAARLRMLCCQDAGRPQQMARLFGVSPATISRVLAGKLSAAG